MERTFTEEERKQGGYLEFRLQKLRYAVPIRSVVEINQVLPITPVPKVPAYFCGVMNLRGKVLAVIDLNVRLTGQATQPTRESCILVVESSSGEVGVLVDAVNRVCNFSEGQLHPAPQTAHVGDQSLICGVAEEGDATITLLDIGRCFGHMDPKAVQDLEARREAPKGDALESHIDDVAGKMGKLIE